MVNIADDGGSGYTAPPTPPPPEDIIQTQTAPPPTSTPAVPVIYEDPALMTYREQERLRRLQEAEEAKIAQDREIDKMLQDAAEYQAPTTPKPEAAEVVMTPTERNYYNLAQSDNLTYQEEQRLNAYLAKTGTTVEDLSNKKIAQDEADYNAALKFVGKVQPQGAESGYDIAGLLKAGVSAGTLSTVFKPGDIEAGIGRVQGEAAQNAAVARVNLSKYSVDGGYNLVAAVWDGASRSDLIAAGFSASVVDSAIKAAVDNPSWKYFKANYTGSGLPEGGVFDIYMDRYGLVSMVKGTYIDFGATIAPPVRALQSEGYEVKPIDWVMTGVNVYLLAGAPGAGKVISPIFNKVAPVVTKGTTAVKNAVAEWNAAPVFGKAKPNTIYDVPEVWGTGQSWSALEAQVSHLPTITKVEPWTGQTVTILNKGAVNSPVTRGMMGEPVYVEGLGGKLYNVGSIQEGIAISKIAPASETLAGRAATLAGKLPSVASKADALKTGAGVWEEGLTMIQSLKAKPNLTGEELKILKTLETKYDAWFNSALQKRAKIDAKTRKVEANRVTKIVAQEIKAQETHWNGLSAPKPPKGGAAPETPFQGGEPGGGSGGSGTVKPPAPASPIEPPTPNRPTTTTYAEPKTVTRTQEVIPLIDARSPGTIGTQVTTAPFFIPVPTKTPEYVPAPMTPAPISPMTPAKTFDPGKTPTMFPDIGGVPKIDTGTTIYPGTGETIVVQPSPVTKTPTPPVVDPVPKPVPPKPVPPIIIPTDQKPPTGFGLPLLPPRPFNIPADRGVALGGTKKKYKKKKGIISEIEIHLPTLTIAASGARTERIKAAGIVEGKYDVFTVKKAEKFNAGVREYRGQELTDFGVGGGL